MARYQIMYWQDIPAHVKAHDDAGEVRGSLSERFQQAIDAAAMAGGSTDSDAYLAGWSWGPEQERQGSAQQVADALLAELEAEYTQTRLQQMVASRKSAG